MDPREALDCLNALQVRWFCLALDRVTPKAFSRTAAGDKCATLGRAAAILSGSA